jgi:tetratricopeptide (TPR) repeat protein
MVVRVGYLLELSDTPLFDSPVVDAATYLDYAGYLTHVSWAGRPAPYWQPPLYPYLLAMLQLVAESLWLPRLLQAVAGSASCVLIWALGRRLFPGPVAVAAALAAAVYGPFVYFSGELLPVTLAILLDLVLLWLLMRLPADPGWRWLVPGAVLGLATLAVATVFVLLPVVLWWLWRHPPIPATATPPWVRGVWFVVGCLVVIGPVTVRNRIVGDDLVFVSHNAGVNFYIGNNPEHDRTVAIRPGRQWLDLVDTPAREAGLQRPSARSRYFIAESWRFISSEPGRWLALTARKFYLFWRGEEIPRNLDLYFARSESSILSALLWQRGLAFPFGLVAPLALVGIVLFLRSPQRRTRDGALLLGFVLAYTVAVVLFFVTSRYRLPVVPVLLLLACSGVHAMTVGSRRVATAAAALVVGVALNVGSAPLEVASAAHEHFWRGWAYETKGMPANAAREYHLALELDPKLEDALLDLAALESRRGNHTRAIELYRRYLSADPDAHPVRRDLAMALLGSGRYLQATRELQHLLEALPERADLYGSLAYAELMANRPEFAAGAYRRVLELRPDSTLVRYQLARLHDSVGRPDSAAAQYRLLLEADTLSTESRLRLADALVSSASRDGSVSLAVTPATREAEAHLRTTLKGDARSLHAHWSLGMLLARQDRYPEATELFERLLELAPEDHVVHLFLGHLLKRTGRLQEAESHFDHYSARRRARRMQETARSRSEQFVKRLFGS